MGPRVVPLVPTPLRSIPVDTGVLHRTCIGTEVPSPQDRLLEGRDYASPLTKYPVVDGESRWEDRPGWTDLGLGVQGRVTP